MRCVPNANGTCIRWSSGLSREHEGLRLGVGSVAPSVSARYCHGQVAGPAASRKILGSNAVDCELLAAIVALHDVADLLVALLLSIAHIASVHGHVNVAVRSDGGEVTDSRTARVVSVEQGAGAQLTHWNPHSAVHLRRW